MNTLAIHAIFATLLCFIQLGISLDFFVMRKYSEISTDYGKSAVLNCSSNSPYEYCTLIHDTDICQMEYKSRKNQVKLINCDFLARMKLIGNLSNNECAIELQNVSGKDAGVWKCIMEEYKFGYVEGDTDTGEIRLVVNGIPPKGNKSKKGTLKNYDYLLLKNFQFLQLRLKWNQLFQFFQKRPEFHCCL